MLHFALLSLPLLAAPNPVAQDPYNGGCVYGPPQRGVKVFGPQTGTFGGGAGPGYRDPRGPRGGGAPAPTPDTPSTGGAYTPPATPAPGLPNSPRPANPVSPRSPMGRPMSAGGANPGTSPGARTTMDPDGWLLWWQMNSDRYVAIDPWSVRPRTLGGDDGSWGGVLEELRRAEIVPALRTALSQDPGNTLRGVLLLSLARIESAFIGEDALGGSDLERILLDHVSSPQRAIASSATISLGILGRPSSLPHLAALMSDTEAGRAIAGGSQVPRSIRSIAAYAIGFAGYRSDNPDVQRYATDALVHALGREAEPGADLRVALVGGLGLIDPGSRATHDNDELARLLLETMQADGEDVAVRAHVPRTLAVLYPWVSGEVGTSIATALMDAVALRREREPVRQGCVLALGMIGDADEDPQDERIRATLMAAAGGGNHSLRTYATVALAQVGARAGAGEGDRRAGTAQVRDHLLRRLPRTKTNTRTWTVLALGLLEREAVGSPSVELRAALRKSLRGARSADLVAAHAVASGLAGDGLAAEPVASRLQEIDGLLRGQTALALGLSGSPQVMDALRATLVESAHRPEVLGSTAHAMALLHDATVVDDLVGLLRDCDCLGSKMAVASALGRTRSPRAVEPLLALLADEDAVELQRIFAAVSLARLAERERMPWSAQLRSDLNYRTATSTLSDLVALP